MAGALTIERVRTRRQLSEFVTLPRRLYDGMPGYVAPLDIEQRQMLDPRKSPFFTHGYAAYWLARRDGRAVGRISAQIDLLAEQPPDLGLFGCLDAIDDRAVVAALLARAEQWLRGHGRRLARGPFLLSINGESGLLIEGHLEPPMTLLGWHPAYLEGHLCAAGYARAMRLHCYDGTLKGVDDRILQRYGAFLPRGDFTVRNFRLDHLAEDAERGRQLFNEAWRNNWGFTPMSESDIQCAMAQFKPLLTADSGFFIEVDGEPAAFVLTLPNVFEIAAGLGPNPSPLGWIKLLYRVWRRRYRSYRLTIFGMASKYHLLGARVGRAAGEEWLCRMHMLGAKTAVSGWVLETNSRAARVVLAMGGRPVRTYGVYEKALVA